MKKAHFIALFAIPLDIAFKAALYAAGIVSPGILLAVIPFWAGYYLYHFIVAEELL